jgi:hypothetical protein
MPELTNTRGVSRARAVQEVPVLLILVACEWSSWSQAWRSLSLSPKQFLGHSQRRFRAVEAGAGVA